ncbi:CHAP domain-containing protein [Olivibacter sp. LS-1]|nr:CHAP domain-containing protein [Olivibacter sp. LS-1]
MNIMLSQVGVREEGNNNGQAVRQYLKSIGLGGGYAWCMALVYWAFGQASEDLGVENPLVKTGGVLRQWNEVNPKFKHSTPKVGDIFIMDFGKGTGHTGMVTGVKGASINTVEGNTNTDGSRNGDGVYERTRLLTSIKGYIRIE